MNNSISEVHTPAKENKKLILARDYLIIAGAAILYALSFILFITPNKFAPAGIGGIVTMVQYKMGFSIGYLYLLLNIPLCIFAFFDVRRRFAVRTMVFVIVYSLAYLAMQHMPLDAFICVSNGKNTILPAIAAGTLSGVVYGIALRVDSSTGGTDIVAACVQKRWPEFSMVWVIFFLNAAVAVVSYFVYSEVDPATGVEVFNFEPVILCIVYCLVSTKVCDAILAGNKQAVKFEVVTDNPEELSADIINELHHTATVISARGMFSNDEKQMLICVVGKRQIVAFQKILARYPGSFAYITSVSETLGFFRRDRAARYGTLNEKKSVEK